MAIVGGNCDNGSKCGRYLNVNNVAGNARWNIGASLICPYILRGSRCPNNVSIFPQHRLKINLPRGAASKCAGTHRREGDKKGTTLLKSFNGLFDGMMDRQEAEESIEEAAQHKKNRPAVQYILSHKKEVAERICEKIERNAWFPPHHERQKLQEGAHKKEREIVKPRFDDEQIVHHMIVRQLRPIIVPRLYRYAYGSLPGRGTHGAVKTMTRWRNEYGEKRFYVFEGDVRKFYDSIDTELLKEKLDKMIRDKRFKTILFRIIYAFTPGLPKGFYPSPWLANFYMGEFDNFVVQTLKPDHYLRYMDNLFILHRNKKELHRMEREIELFLRERLHLQLKSDWQVYRFEKKKKPEGMTEDETRQWQRRAKGRAINALGFIIHRDRVTIRKSILKRARAKANHIHKRKRYTRHDAASMISRMGPFRHADAYGYYLNHIKPKVSIRYCKRRLSTLAKREQTRKERMGNDRVENCEGQPGGGTGCR